MKIKDLVTREIIEDIYYYFIRINLRSEWNIWFKCYGKVIVINGPSSCGKSTLISYFKKSGFNEIVLSDAFYEKEFKDVDSKDHCIILHTNIFMKVYYQMYEEAKKFIYSGENVIIETVMPNDEEVSRFIYCFNNYPVSFGLLYTSLDSNLYNCFHRNELSLQIGILANMRNPATVIDQYCCLYKFVAIDNMSFKPIYLDTIKKKVIKDIFHDVVPQVSIFLTQFPDNDIDALPKAHYLKLVRDILSRANKLMVLDDTDSIVSVIPSIKHHFIIQFIEGKSYNLFSNHCCSTDLINSNARSSDINEIIDMIGDMDNSIDTLT